MTKAGRITIEMAQSEILSSSPACFTFGNPPSVGWWKAKPGVNLASVAFVHHYQSIVGTKVSMNHGRYGESDFAPRWQAAAGISPKQWEGVKLELGAGGISLLSFSIDTMKSKKCTWIRPSDELLLVFGMTLQTYDIVVGLDWRISVQLSGLSKKSALPTLAHEQFDALSLWASRGGLARLTNAEKLGEILQAHVAAQPDVHHA